MAQPRSNRSASLPTAREFVAELRARVELEIVLAGYSRDGVPLSAEELRAIPVAFSIPTPRDRALWEQAERDHWAEGSAAAAEIERRMQPSAKGPGETFGPYPLFLTKKGRRESRARLLASNLPELWKGQKIAALEFPPNKVFPGQAARALDELDALASAIENGSSVDVVMRHAFSAGGAWAVVQSLSESRTAGARREAPAPQKWWHAFVRDALRECGPDASAGVIRDRFCTATGYKLVGDYLVGGRGRSRGRFKDKTFENVLVEMRKELRARLKKGIPRRS